MNLNSYADGFEVCIGLSQILVILELIITIKLYKEELNCESQESIEEA